MPDVGKLHVAMGGHPDEEEGGRQQLEHHLAHQVGGNCTTLSAKMLKCLFLFAQNIPFIFSANKGYDEHVPFF